MYSGIYHDVMYNVIQNVIENVLYKYGIYQYDGIYHSGINIMVCTILVYIIVFVN
jgi:hypothetical protein